MMEIILGIIGLIMCFFLCWGLYRFCLVPIRLLLRILKKMGYAFPTIEKIIPGPRDRWELWSSFWLCLILTIMSLPFYAGGIFSWAVGLRPMNENILDTRNIWQDAEQQGGLAQSEENSAQVAHNILLHRFPIGTELEPLIPYLEKSGFKCSGEKKWMEPGYYCDLSHEHWLPIANIVWRIFIYKNDRNLISKIRILVHFNTI